MNATLETETPNVMMVTDSGLIPASEIKEVTPADKRTDAVIAGDAKTVAQLHREEIAAEKKTPAGERKQGSANQLEAKRTAKAKKEVAQFNATVATAKKEAPAPAKKTGKVSINLATTAATVPVTAQAQADAAAKIRSERRVTRGMLGKIGRAHSKADKQITEEGKVAFCELLLDDKVPIMSISSSKIAKYIKGEVKLEELK